jgi:curved DNA-binding protein CbpA
MAGRGLSHRLKVVMTPQSELELQGSFFAHPFAELVAEIAQARLNGSLRVSDKVSNARKSRFFDILRRQNKLSNEEVTQFPNFANDLEFAAYLQDTDLLTKQECDLLFIEQIEGIILDILLWPSGDWAFSHLARVRDGLAFDIDTPRLLIDYARFMPVDIMLGRFRSLDEGFVRSELPATGIGLNSEEAFVLSRTDDGALTAAGLTSIAAMPEATALHLIYTLWLGGLLVRDGWQSAFSNAAVLAMQNARLELKREAKQADIPLPAVKEKEPEIAIDAPPLEPEVTISLEEYLVRVENAETHYDILGVDQKAEIDELKQAYFTLAKNFHPDRYHAEGGEQLQRIQRAFTELAQAHETLKNPESREVYDYRVRKELAKRNKHLPAGNLGDQNVQTEQAAENFERGYSLFMDNEQEAALPFLARAAHFDPKNGRYRAYYGKVLATDEKQRHKAETEMQAALKLEPNNPTFRLFLAELFIQYNLLKRAEGELTRLLAMFPTNREALKLLEGLRK